MSKNSIKILPVAIILMTAVLFAGCNRGGGDEEEAAANSGAQLEQEVNKFLQDNEIQVSEDGERANLAGTGESGATGVATSEPDGGESEMMVLASLPEPTSGSYHAWLKNGEEYEYVGPLTEGKGGYLIEKNVSGQAVQGQQVVVSREEQLGSAPTEVVLEGSF